MASAFASPPHRDKLSLASALTQSVFNPAAASAGEHAPLIGGTDRRSRKPLDRLFDGLRWTAYDAVRAGFSGFLLSLPVC